jgi:hypothetical protein
MKIAFAAAEYLADQNNEPSTPFFYEVSFPSTEKKADGGVRRLKPKQIAENLAEAILARVEDELKESRDPEGCVTIDPKSSWGDIAIDMGDDNSYIYLTFPKGYEAIEKALKKLPKSELTVSWTEDE